MTLPKLSFLILGDLHYPDFIKLESADIHDKGMLKYINNVIPQNKSEVVAKAIMQLLAEEEVDAVLVVGDLSKRGNTEDYNLGVVYICNIIMQWLKSKGDVKVEFQRRVNVVPGNHDVNTEAIPLTDKFQHIIDSWTSQGPATLAINNLTLNLYGDENKQVNVIGLNSCVLCGEFRLLDQSILDEKIKDAVVKILEDNSAPAEREELLREKLSTPAFHSDDLTQLSSELSKTSSTLLTLLLAHHNILPQAIARVAPYAELINGGMLRAQINRSKKSVVYCHGHIHDEAIEVITFPGSPEGQLVAVSCPEMKDGFTLMEVFFSTQGLPIGCRVNRFKFNASTYSSDGCPVDIPLATYNRFEEYVHSDFKKVIQSISGRHRFNEIVGLNPSIDIDSLTHIICEAAWLGAISITNSKGKPEDWHIKRLIP